MPLTELPENQKAMVEDYRKKRKEELLNKRILSLISILLIAGMLYSIFLFLLPKEKTNYSLLYLYPDSYSNEVGPDNLIPFSYSIENHEINSMEYIARIFFDEKLIKEEKIFINKDEKKIMNEEFFFEEKNFSDPFKVRVIVNSLDAEYEVYFWIKE